MNVCWKSVLLFFIIIVENHTSLQSSRTHFDGILKRRSTYFLPDDITYINRFSDDEIFDTAESDKDFAYNTETSALEASKLMNKRDERNRNKEQQLKGDKSFERLDAPSPKLERLARKNVNKNSFVQFKRKSSTSLNNTYNPRNNRWIMNYATENDDGIYSNTQSDSPFWEYQDFSNSPDSFQNKKLKTKVALTTTTKRVFEKTFRSTNYEDDKDDNDDSGENTQSENNKSINTWVYDDSDRNDQRDEKTDPKTESDSDSDYTMKNFETSSLKEGFEQSNPKDASHRNETNIKKLKKMINSINNLASEQQDDVTANYNIYVGDIERPRFISSEEIVDEATLQTRTTSESYNDYSGIQTESRKYYEPTMTAIDYDYETTTEYNAVDYENEFRKSFEDTKKKLNVVTPAIFPKDQLSGYRWSKKKRPNKMSGHFNLEKFLKNELKETNDYSDEFIIPEDTESSRNESLHIREPPRLQPDRQNILNRGILLKTISDKKRPFVNAQDNINTKQNMESMNQNMVNAAEHKENTTKPFKKVPSKPKQQQTLKAGPKMHHQIQNSTPFINKTIPLTTTTHKTYETTTKSQNKTIILVKGHKKFPTLKDNKNHTNSLHYIKNLITDKSKLNDSLTTTTEHNVKVTSSTDSIALHKKATLQDITTTEEAKLQLSSVPPKSTTDSTRIVSSITTDSIDDDYSELSKFEKIYSLNETSLNKARSGLKENELLHDAESVFLGTSPIKPINLLNNSSKAFKIPGRDRIIDEKNKEDKNKEKLTKDHKNIEAATNDYINTKAQTSELSNQNKENSPLPPKHFNENQFNFLYFYENATSRNMINSEQNDISPDSILNKKQNRMKIKESYDVIPLVNKETSRPRKVQHNKISLPFFANPVFKNQSELYKSTPNALTTTITTTTKITSTSKATTTSSKATITPSKAKTTGKVSSIKQFPAVTTKVIITENIGDTLNISDNNVKPIKYIGGGGGNDEFYDTDDDTYENDPLFVLENYFETTTEKFTPITVLKNITKGAQSPNSTKVVTEELINALIKKTNYNTLKNQIATTNSNHSESKKYFSLFKNLVQATLDVLDEASKPKGNNNTTDTPKTRMFQKSESEVEHEAENFFDETFSKGIFSDANIYHTINSTTYNETLNTPLNVGVEHDLQPNITEKIDQFDNEPIFSDVDFLEIDFEKTKILIESIIDAILNKSFDIKENPSADSSVKQEKMKAEVIETIYDKFLNSLKLKNDTDNGHIRTYSNEDKHSISHIPFNERVISLDNSHQIENKYSNIISKATDINKYNNTYSSNTTRGAFGKNKKQNFTNNEIKYFIPEINRGSANFAIKPKQNHSIQTTSERTQIVRPVVSNAIPKLLSNISHFNYNFNNQAKDPKYKVTIGMNNDKNNNLNKDELQDKVNSTLPLTERKEANPIFSSSKGNKDTKSRNEQKNMLTAFIATERINNNSGPINLSRNDNDYYDIEIKFPEKAEITHIVTLPSSSNFTTPISKSTCTGKNCSVDTKLFNAMFKSNENKIHWNEPTLNKSLVNSTIFTPINIYQYGPVLKSNKPKVTTARNLKHFMIPNKENDMWNGRPFIPTNDIEDETTLERKNKEVKISKEKNNFVDLKKGFNSIKSPELFQPALDFKQNKADMTKDLIEKLDEFIRKLDEKYLLQNMGKNKVVSSFEKTANKSKLNILSNNSSGFWKNNVADEIFDDYSTQSTTETKNYSQPKKTYDIQPNQFVHELTHFLSFIKKSLTKDERKNVALNVKELINYLDSNNSKPAICCKKHKVFKSLYNIFRIVNKVLNQSDMEQFENVANKFLDRENSIKNVYNRNTTEKQYFVKFNDKENDSHGENGTLVCINKTILENFIYEVILALHSREKSKIPKQDLTPKCDENLVKTNETQYNNTCTRTSKITNTYVPHFSEYNNTKAPQTNININQNLSDVRLLTKLLNYTSLPKDLKDILKYVLGNPKVSDLPEYSTNAAILVATKNKPVSIKEFYEKKITANETQVLFENLQQKNSVDAVNKVLISKISQLNSILKKNYQDLLSNDDEITEDMKNYYEIFESYSKDSPQYIEAEAKNKYPNNNLEKEFLNGLGDSYLRHLWDSEVFRNFLFKNTNVKNLGHKADTISHNKHTADINLYLENKLKEVLAENTALINNITSVLKYRDRKDSVKPCHKENPAEQSIERLLKKVLLHRDENFEITKLNKDTNLQFKSLALNNSLEKSLNKFLLGEPISETKKTESVPRTVYIDKKAFAKPHYETKYFFRPAESVISLSVPKFETNADERRNNASIILGSGNEMLQVTTKESALSHLLNIPFEKSDALSNRNFIYAYPEIITNSTLDTNNQFALNNASAFARPKLKHTDFQTPNPFLFTPNKLLFPKMEEYVTPKSKWKISKSFEFKDSLCGIENNFGIVERIDKYPWLGVLLHFDANGAQYAVTSVVLVTDRFVLASAVEVDRIPKKSFRRLAKVVLGQTCNKTQIPIVNYNYHPDFRDYKYNSIALIQIDALTTYFNVMPICGPPHGVFSQNFYGMAGYEDCTNPFVEVYPIEKVGANLCRRNYAKMWYESPWQVVSQPWPRHSLCGESMYARNCGMTRTPILVTRLNERWHLLGLGTSKACSISSRYIDYSMYAEWVTKAVDSIGQPTVSRVASNRLILRRLRNQMQRFGPCDAEETKNIIFSDAKLIQAGSDSISEIITTTFFNISFKSADYHCIVICAHKMDKQTEIPHLNVKEINIEPKNDVMKVQFGISFIHSVKYTIQAFGPNLVRENNLKSDIIQQKNKKYVQNLKDDVNNKSKHKQTVIKYMKNYKLKKIRSRNFDKVRGYNWKFRFTRK